MFCSVAEVFVATSNNNIQSVMQVICKEEAVVAVCTPVDCRAVARRWPLHLNTTSQFHH